MPEKRSTTIVVLLAMCAMNSAALAGAHSVAREWNEENLSAIRLDYARPTIHARNLYHVSVAMWDAWSAYDSIADQVLHHERGTIPMGETLQSAREQAISHAAYRVLLSRYSKSPGSSTTVNALVARMTTLGYDPLYFSTVGPSPASLGNRVAVSVIAHGLSDGANEAGGYENLFYEPINPPLLPDFPGNPDIIDPNRWQPLALDWFKDQSGNPIPEGYPDFLSPEWGIVTPFALSQDDLTIYQRDGFDYWVYHDPGPPPLHNGVGDAYYKWGAEQVAIWSSHLDPADGVMWDVSPASIGNATLPDPSEWATYYNLYDGGDWGTGYKENPVTQQPYVPQSVPRGDYARILAEFWADGPESETPPGHWFTILNYVNDHVSFEKRLGGTGDVLDDLEWDVKVYLAMGGAMHDAAIAAWGVKGWYDYIRPISSMRYLADEGQCSDNGQPSFDLDGINLHTDLIEVVTIASTAPGERHEDLAGEEGKIAMYGWLGHSQIIDPATDTAGVGWMLIENWWPYQRPSFVTPPFAGYVSGHSTYSRAAAELMTLLTGSPYFPDGLGEFPCLQDEFLVFEDGPSMNVTLQWASYGDASDQCSLSRIWGGIHPGADDLPGRKMGEVIGPDAFDLAVEYYNGTLTPCPADITGPGDAPDGNVDALDLLQMIAEWGSPCGGACTADISGPGGQPDGNVDALDFLLLISVWGGPAPCAM